MLVLPAPVVRSTVREHGSALRASLRLLAARRGETLSDIAARSGSEWSAAKMAIANAMTIKAKLSGGESVV
jgi:predicted Zn-dependent protease